MLGSYVDLGNPISSHPLNYGLVAWWQPLPGSAVGTTLRDLTGYYPATLTNFPSSPTATSGFGGGPAPQTFPTVAFDGGDDYMTVTAGSGVLVKQYDFTWEIWLWPAVAGAGTTRALMSGGNGQGFVRLTSSNQVELLLSQVTSLGSSTATATAGQWHHIALAQTGSAGNRTIYLDGVNVLSQAGGLAAGTNYYLMREQGNWNATEGFLGAAAVFSRGLSADEVQGRYDQYARGLPDLLRRWNRRSYLFGTSGSSPVTVALTGQSATSTPGTLTPSTAVTLTGSAGTGGTGTLLPDAAKTLTGQYVTAYGPTSIPCPGGQARQYDVGPFTGGTGDYATLTGTVRVNRDTAYDSHTDDPIEWKVGYSGTVGPWTLLFQWVYAGQIGSGTRKIVASATAPGGLLAGYAQDTGLTDCCGTYGTFLEENAGTGTPPDPPDVTPVGLCEGCGDLLPTAAVPQTGQAVTPAAGTVTYSASTTLTGLSSTTDTGTLTPETGYVISLTGQSLVTSAGTTTPAVATTLTGDNATGAAGTMVAGVAYTLVGNGVTTAAGAVTATIATTLTGDAATTAVGTLIADLSTALTGSGVTTTTGTLTPALAAAIVGLSTTPAQGTIDPQTGWLIPLTGQSVTVSQGTLGVSITVGITGQSAAVSQGSLTASVYVPFGELYGKWAYPQPKTGRWQYTSPKAGKWAYPDELAGRWTPSV